MMNLKVASEFFDAKATLECGQLFRFKPFKKGYLLFSRDKACYLFTENGETELYFEDENKEYFENYFDLKKDYSGIYNRALNSGYEILSKAATLGRGVRILKQDGEESLFSFIISQNNHIPRIKSIIERICFNLGEEREFMGEKFYTFPSYEKLAEKDKEYYFSLGLGYRAEYIESVAKSLAGGFSLEEAKNLQTELLKSRLLSLKGVGPKVADCVTLFGFNRSDSFPVDTWIEKIYKEDFKGELTDRKKITRFFTDTFGCDSGYFQQYLFYYKRSLEKENI